LVNQLVDIIPQDKAFDYVFGYSCMNEACLRDYQRHSSQINPGKNFEQTGAIGPWLRNSR
jgi:2-keto-4-pentenoate hydratase/2-oxohepta-3-ene-1,7-dioic acid hydratase in catechol pathway